MKILDKIKFSYLSLQKLKSKKKYFFFPFYHIGGAETVHLDIIKLFNKDDSNVCIITNQSIDSSNKKAFESHISVFDIHHLISKIKDFHSVLSNYGLVVKEEKIAYQKFVFRLNNF